MGHAEYAKKRLFGKEPDILCAAISVIIKCDFENSIPQDKTVFLMDFMVFSLQKLSRQYGEQYLQVKIEEV
jgi:uncharacterized protein YsxB (DUF464 family)